MSWTLRARSGRIRRIPGDLFRGADPDRRTPRTEPAAGRAGHRAHREPVRRSDSAAAGAHAGLRAESPRR
ncbi:hypothetical protein DEF23_13445 [Marinitenerispora sediminis]|uniref:Uncharacterized protein n=1 Tax=Marinitenerispora sediminis TaxID=1931232 RepID=A0A368SZM4_9ACTN|nr:hypothetical protein DEF28_18875 [Marinitenerispora sediminis]RCV51372.1 hypothetical protein DEF24_23260 [Marinitenerispora sediminis]RCV56000.1 hypothetical protein DEF23_13445 [Marinitenerispora sediminis]